MSNQNFNKNTLESLINVSTRLFFPIKMALWGVKTCQNKRICLEKTLKNKRIDTLIRDTRVCQITLIVLNTKVTRTRFQKIMSRMCEHLLTIHSRCISMRVMNLMSFLIDSTALVHHLFITFLSISILSYSIEVGAVQEISEILLGMGIIFYIP